MTAVECVSEARAAGARLQQPINAFVDDFRRADHALRARMIADPVVAPGDIEGLVSAVVSALCREQSVPTPAWVDEIGSPSPFFPFPARTFEMRLRLMLESPAPFRIRRVFVPENYLSRA